jgi:hypothetical protein
MEYEWLQTARFAIMGTFCTAMYMNVISCLDERAELNALRIHCTVAALVSCKVFYFVHFYLPAPAARAEYCELEEKL